MPSGPRNILNRINDTIITFDREGKISFVNEAFATVVGSVPSDMIGKNVWKILPRLAESITYKNINEALQKNQPAFFEWQGPYIGRIWETKVFPSEEGITAIGRDITERKKAEEALRLSEEKFYKAFNNSPTSIAITRFSDGKIIEASAYSYKLMGYGYEETKGKTTAEINMWPYADERNKLAEDLEETGFAEMEVTLQRKDGTRFPAVMSASLITVAGEKCILSTVVDLTERKKAEESLKASEATAKKQVAELERLHERLELKTAEVEQYATKMESLAKERAKKLQDAERLAAIGATAGMVGHDIRNPLQAIIGDLYLLNDILANLPQGNEKEEMKESLESITDNVSYINKIVADLQDYARPLNPEYSIFDLPKLVEETIHTVTVPGNIKLSFKAGTLAAVKSDQIYLRRSITNLVNNAIQAMPNGGNLEVACANKDNKATITIADTGVGIPEHVKPKLFTPMMTTKSKGQGLGLAVVKRLIEALKGTITFESLEGKGTKFIIELPG